MSNAQSIISQLTSTIGTFTSNIDSCVSDVDQQTAIARNTADQAKKEIHDFKERMIANEQMQSAHENIIRLDQAIREKFESNIKVRKTVSGVVKDFDINLCRNSTIEELSEELWITSSRYWLSFALISISAWVNDSKVLATNAVSESVRVNSVKSTLFFCLVNLRFGRMDAAKKWLSAYFDTVVPDEIKDETAILLQSYINGIFGTDKALELKVQGVVDDWVRTVSMNEALSQELVRDYEEYIYKIHTGKTFSCPTLMAHCKEAQALQYPYLESFKYKKLIEFIDSLDVENTIQNASNYKQRIDAIISDLISNYDEEEQKIREEKEYYQLIIDNRGNMEAAQAQFDERLRVRNQTQNIGRKLVGWALYKTSEQVDGQVRKFAFQNSREWFMTALERWSSAFEEKFPTKYTITVDDWSAESTGEDQYELEHSLREHLEQNKNSVMYFNKANKTLFVWLMIFVGVGLGINLWAAPSGILPSWGPYVGYGCFGLALVFAIIITVRCLTAGRKFRKMVEEKLSVLTQSMTELTEIRRVYFENLKDKNTLFSKAENL